MATDEKAIEEHIRGILTALGDDPQREGLADTPARVARMYAEMFEGMNYAMTKSQICSAKLSKRKVNSANPSGYGSRTGHRDFQPLRTSSRAHVRYGVYSSLRPRRQSHRPQQNRKNRRYGFQAPSAPGTNRS